jgi:hypothetical protein
MATARDHILSLAEDTKKRPANMKEIGTRENDLDVSLDGRLDDQDDISLETYRKMRQDPQVKACLLVLKLPLLQVDFNINADSDDGKKIARWVESRIYDMDDSMQYYMREMLTALDFGRSITEKVWALRTVSVDPDEENSREEQMVIPLKLKTYDPRSLTFKLNPKTLKLEGVIQRRKNGQEITIPSDKLLIYSHEKEFGDYNGLSVLKAAYKPWIIKEFLQKFWNIALERYGTPFSTMKMPQGGDLKTALKLMDSIKSKTGIPLPEGYEMTIHNLANTGMSFKEAIEYQDRMIARAMLIPDLVFGNSDSGAYALSKTHATFFLLRLNGIGQELSDMITKYLIKPLVQYNFGDVKEYPELKMDDVSEDTKETLLNIVKEMLTGHVIAPQESWIRERLGLPPADEDTQEWLDKKRESSMKMMDAAGQPPGQDPKGDPVIDVNADPDDKNNAKKKEGVQKNSEEELDDYLSDLRAGIRGVLKLGIGADNNGK